MYSDVVHDKTYSKFYVKLSQDNPDLEGVLLYDKVGDNLYDFYHTEVPPEFRGRGIAAELARTGIEFIVQENAKVILTCSYLRSFGEKNLSGAERQHVEP